MTLPFLLFFLGLLATHFVADFVLQPDWIAKGKSSSLNILVTHILIYTVTFIPIAFLHFHPSAALAFLFINALAHFLIDFVTSRITSTLYKAGDTHNFFVVIGFDQFLHVATLLTTAYYLSI